MTQTEEHAIAQRCNFDARVLDALRHLIERSEAFDEHEVHIMFGLAEDALANAADEPQISPELFAAQIVYSASMMMNAGPGWRLSH